MSSITHLILIRHGQIQANVDKRWHGWTDSELTETGLLQAERVAQRIAREHPDVTAIYASPLKRTYKTAENIARLLDLDIIEEPQIKEYGIGVLEGERFSDLHKTHAFFEQVEADPLYAPQAGESISQVGCRVRTALQGFVERHPGEKIVAVSHGAAMALGLAGLLDDGDWYAWNKYHFMNTIITEPTIASDANTLVRLNCTEHLEGL